MGSDYRVAVFDERTNTAVNEPSIKVGDDVLVFDGIFAQRPELAGYWDLVVFLDGQQRVDLERLGLVMENLPVDPVEAIAHVLTWVARIDRYASGMRYYIDLVDPLASAHVVIDNNRIERPVIIKAPGL